ncbi:MAG: hypothetical protein ABI461_16675 [Polyangiaceae bacterium]
MSPQPLRVCLVDMNNGVANQATRCFRRLTDAFAKRVREKNPDLDIVFRHVQPRNLGELPGDDADIVLSSGGPGSPHDGFHEDSWCLDYRKYLDGVVEKNLRTNGNGPKAFLVCHSFEIAVLHFKVAEMRKRPTTKFGVMPAYITDSGQKSGYYSPFGYRLFTWEHRNWEAVNPDTRRITDLGGEILSTESHRKAVVNRGDAILGLTFGHGIDGVQFHPEADKAGVLAWIEDPEHAATVESAYGATLYEKMVKSLANPNRLARTFALMIPSWLTLRFNEIARERGLRPLDSPEQAMQDFDVAV